MSILLVSQITWIIHKSPFISTKRSQVEIIFFYSVVFIASYGRMTFFLFSVDGFQYERTSDSLLFGLSKF